MSTPSSLRELFDAASELSPDARAAFLDANCSDSELRRRLERMLAAGAGPGGAMPSTPAEELARAIDESDATPSFGLGSRIGSFELIAVLGEGGSSTVFRAVREVDGVRQEVALKLLHRSLHSPHARRQFRRERRALTQLQHPGIARLIEGGITENGLAYIALELVDGEPITFYAREKNLDVRERLTLFLQVCRAVEAAHHALIVHSDLKPSNALVTGDGTVKLLDFGIAKLLDSDDETQTHVPSFTPAYAAPEQRSGDPITTATDVYALGILLGELLTGRRSNPGARIPSQETLVDDATGWSSVATNHMRRPLRGDLENIVSKAVDAQPTRRYTSAGALADDIERWLDGRPVAAHPPSQMYKMLKFVQRHRGAVASTCAFLLAIFSALGIALWQANVARAEAQRANAVKKFLMDIFDAAKANLPSNERPTPEALVREASQRARSDASIAPDLRADLLRTLGSVSLTLGDYPQAEALLDESLQRLDEAGAAATSRERLDAVVQKSNLLQRTNRNAEADALLLEALPALRAQNDDVAIDGLMALAVTRLYAGHADEGLAFAQEAAAKAAALWRPNSLERIKVESFPGQLDAGLRRWKESVAQLDPIVARWRALGAPPDIEFAHALNNLAVAKGRTGDRAGAEALFRENIALRRRIYGDKPNDGLAAALEGFAIFLTRQEAFDEAQTLLDEALSINTRVLGPDNLQVASTLDTIGTLEGSRRRFAESERHLRAALALYAAHVGDAGEQDNDLELTQLHLTQTLMELGRFDEAQSLDAQALAGLRKKNGDASDLVASALALASRIAIEQGDADCALKSNDDALAILTKLDSPSPAAVVGVRTARAKIFDARNRYADAIVEINRALDALRAASPDAHSKIASLLAFRARGEQAASRPDAAAATIAEAHALGVPASLLSPADAATLGVR